MPNRRKAQEKYKNLQVSKARPLDLSILGTKDDPCFGKLYSPKEDECKQCGDCEICAIVYSQTTLVKKRKAKEKEETYVDTEPQIDEVNKYKRVKDLIIKKLKKKRKPEAILAQLSISFDFIPEVKLKTLIKECQSQLKHP